MYRGIKPAVEVYRINHFLPRGWTLFRKMIPLFSDRFSKILSVTGKVKYNLVDKYALISAVKIDKQQALAGKLELASFGSDNSHFFG
jgi:hypothetical protein